MNNTGNPIFNETILESKNSGLYIDSYKLISGKKDLFDEVWIEKKGYYTNASNDKSNNKSSNLLTLNFSFKNKAKLDLKILNTNFEYAGYGYTNEIFKIMFLNNDFLEKDTVKVTFTPDNQLIFKKYGSVH